MRLANMARFSSPCIQCGDFLKSLALISAAPADSISEQEAENILYRRELHQVGSGRTYNPSAKPGKNSIVVAA
jgi:hypothetical protein